VTGHLSRARSFRIQFSCCKSRTTSMIEILLKNTDFKTNGFLFAICRPLRIVDTRT
jgi:hypothetical protein